MSRPEAEERPARLLLDGVPLKSFYLTVVVAVMATVLLVSLPGECVFLPQTRQLDSVFTVLDPLVCHGVAALWLVLLVARLRRRRGRWRLRDFFWAGVIVLALLCLIWILEVFWLKEVFARARPDPSADEPKLLRMVADWPILSWILSKVGRSSSTPSGFVMRQIWLGLAALVTAAHSRQKPLEDTGIGDRERAGLGVAAWVLVCLVGLGRVYWRRHTFLDVGLGIGAGTLTFWLCVMVHDALVSGLGKRQWVGGTRFVTGIMAFSAVSAVLYLFYCTRVHLWAVSSVCVFFAIGCCFMVAGMRRPSEMARLRAGDIADSRRGRR